MAGKAGSHRSTGLLAAGIILIVIGTGIVGYYSYTSMQPKPAGTHESREQRVALFVLVETEHLTMKLKSGLHLTMKSKRNEVIDANRGVGILREAVVCMDMLTIDTIELFDRAVIAVSPPGPHNSA